MKALMIHNRQLNSDLTQWAECETDDLEVVGSIPSRGKFKFCFSPSILAGSCHDLAGNDELQKTQLF